jgi:hypothetical protein
MKVKVKRSDIENGRRDAGCTCGCPIHIALSRKLKIKGDFDGELRVPSVYKATIGRIKIPLPEVAVEFQNKLMKDENAKVKPFEFETELVAP